MHFCQRHRNSLKCVTQNRHYSHATRAKATRTEFFYPVIGRG